MIKIAASIMCANWCHLQKEVQELEAAGIDIFHFDIMDGHFVPNLTMGPQVLEALRPLTKLPFDAHLMIREPQRYLERFVEAGADIISIHAEACLHLHRVVANMKGLGIKVGVALNPATPLNVLEYVLKDLDMVLIMTVNPGFAGGEFIPAMVNKVRDLKRKVTEGHFKVDIQVDGSINVSTAPKLVKAGANILVGGSSGLFLKDKSFKEALRDLRESIRAKV